MAKAKVNDLINMGFAAEQFGGAPGFDAEEVGGYVHDILDEVEVAVRLSVTDTVYDAATINAADKNNKRNYSLIKSAERYYCAAQLWQNRIQFIDQSAMVQRSNDVPVNPQKQYADLESKYIERAEKQLSALSGNTVEGGSSFGMVESGSFSRAG